MQDKRRITVGPALARLMMALAGLGGAATRALDRAVSARARSRNLGPGTAPRCGRCGWKLRNRSRHPDGTGASCTSERHVFGHRVSPGNIPF